MKTPLYPHNQKTYDNVMEMFKIHNRVCAVQPTGSGKSFLIMACAEHFDGKKIILAPSKSILNQTKKHMSDFENVIYMTYSKLSFMSEEELNNLNPELIVLDEFHRCGAKEWGRGLDDLLAKYPNTKVFGTSATNIRYLDDNRDMAEELFDNHKAVDMRLPEALVEGILPKFDYVSALYTFDKVFNDIKDKINNSSNSIEEKNELLDKIKISKADLKHSKGIPQILKKYLHNKSNGKYIVFCKDKIHLDEMKTTVEDWFKKAKLAKEVHSYEVYSENNDCEIQFENFKADNSDTLRLLFSIEMLNEGVHLKDIDGVILLRPTNSPIVYFQQIGRAIEAGKESKSIIFDFVNNYGNFGAINLKNEIDKVIEEKCGRNSKGEPIDICDFNIIDEMQKVTELMNDIFSRLIDDWDVRYAELVRFYEENGHCCVKTKGNKLGEWVRYQRVCYKKEILTQEKLEKLNKIKFVWDVLDEQFYIGLSYLKQYSDKFGDCLVPSRYKNNDNYALGSWVIRIRSSFNSKNLCEKYINELNKLSFVWDVEKYNFNNMIYLITEYIEINKLNNCNIPFIVIYKDIKIGILISTCRNSYKNKILPQYKIKKLEELNIKWDWDNNDENWYKNFKEIIEFKKQFGHVCIPKTYVTKNGVKLGAWMGTQKQNYKKGKLSQERINKLLEIGLDFNPPKGKARQNLSKQLNSETQSV